VTKAFPSEDRNQSGYSLALIASVTEVLRKAQAEFAGIVAQHDQDIIAGIQAALVVAFIGDVAAVGAQRPAAIGGLLGDVEVQQIA
jgi:hypothetical protein